MSPFPFIAQDDVQKAFKARGYSLHLCTNHTAVPFVVLRVLRPEQPLSSQASPLSQQLMQVNSCGFRVR